MQYLNGAVLEHLRRTAKALFNLAPQYRPVAWRHVHRRLIPAKVSPRHANVAQKLVVPKTSHTTRHVQSKSNHFSGRQEEGETERARVPGGSHAVHGQHGKGAVLQYKAPAL